MLAKVPRQNATYIVFPDRIEITTFKRASVEGRLQQPVAAKFDNRKLKLSEALRELSEMTGTSIVIDARIGDKEDRQVTATFRNDVTLAGALRVLTEQADVKYVVLKEGILFVTTPAHVETLRKENALLDINAVKKPPQIAPSEPTTFTSRKLSEILDELADETGTTIVIDQRVGNKKDAHVSVTFQTGFNIIDAVRVLTEMTELKLVVLKGGVLFVTTPAHAETLRKDMSILETGQ
jgi:hypothetical protein